MKLIAFKRAKSSPNIKDTLHPEFITEYADTALFPVGFHKESDGYELLHEDLFDIELEKNKSYHDQFLAEKKKKEDHDIKVKEQLYIVEQAEEKKAHREFEEFLKWKKMKGK